MELSTNPSTVRYRRWRAANLAKAREKERTFRRENPEVRTVQARRYRDRYPEKVRAADRKRQGLPEPTRPEPKVCECCGNPAGERALHLDHCHVTGAFRGWLCVKCNLGIGKLGDNVAGLRRAITYLEGLL